MTEPIKIFQGEYRFLSNFYACIIIYEGRMYPSSEHAFQASKTDNCGLKDLIAEQYHPREAKAIGRRCKLIPDWDAKKLDIMEEILRIKFDKPFLRDKLLGTKDAELIEGNWWGDRFWGVCDDEGENHLGRLLMKIREDLRNEDKKSNNKKIREKA